MAAINTNDYELSTFSGNYALSGGTLFAKRSDGKYFIATGFRTTTAYGRRFPYEAQIEEITYFFDEKGVTAQKTFQLYCAKRAAGTEDTTIISYFNAKEKIAIEVLKEMVSGSPEPLSYSGSTIRLLVDKAFAFSDEFIQQALTRRQNDGGSQEEETVGDNSVEESLVSISNTLLGIKRAFINEYHLRNTDLQQYMRPNTVINGANGNIGNNNQFDSLILPVIGGERVTINGLKWYGTVPTDIGEIWFYTGDGQPTAVLSYIRASREPDVPVVVDVPVTATFIGLVITARNFNASGQVLNYDASATVNVDVVNGPTTSGTPTSVLVELTILRNTIADIKNILEEGDDDSATLNLLTNIKTNTDTLVTQTTAIKNNTDDLESSIG